MKGLKTNADVFSSRGDPWMTRKDGMNNFGRNVYTEDPDFDRYFAPKAKESPPEVVKARPVVAQKLTESRRILAISLELKAKLREKGIK